MGTAVRDERRMTGAHSPDQLIPPGTAVRHDGLGYPEYRIVVHCWLNLEIAKHDCYVAFFGSELPTGKPDEKPYILRYAAASLTRLDVG